MNKNFWSKYFESNKLISSHRFLRHALKLLILCGALLTTLFLSSCKEQKKQTVAATNKDVYYTCSMHPQNTPVIVLFAA